MNQLNDIPSDLGTQLVDILYSNTKLNYDICAVNLVQIFEHLSLRLPQLTSLSQTVIQTIQTSVVNEEINPDLITLNSNLKYLSNLNSDLQKGETNLYECNQTIEKLLKQSNRLLTQQSNLNVFKQTLSENRLEILTLFEIWQLSTNKTIKNNIIQLFNLCCQSDPALISLLYENTNLTSELCSQLKQDITTSDHLSIVSALKCLITLFTNTERGVTQRFCDFLKETNFLTILFETIETEENFLFLKLNQLDDVKKNDFTVLDLFIHFILALNQKFQLIEENLIIQFMNLNEENRKYLSEMIINLINFEGDPLLSYKIENLVRTTNDWVCYINPAVKFVSDLFSSEITQHSTSIFYLNDFNVLIDIVIRKLTNLSQTDQARVDYLTLIQSIIKNSNYKLSFYRKNDLIEIFNSILKEPNETIDQDIVRIILFENNNFK